MPADYTILRVDAQDINFDTTDGVTGCIRPTMTNTVLLALYKSLSESTQEQIHSEMKDNLKRAVEKCFVNAMKSFAMQVTDYPGPRYARGR
jgi:hypothetical protein